MITYNEVVSALLAEDLQQKLMVSSKPSISSSSAMALNANQGRTKWRTKVGFRSSEDNSQFIFHSKSHTKRTFFKCGKPQHAQKDCRIKNFSKASPNVLTNGQDTMYDSQHFMIHGVVSLFYGFTMC